jgi:DNA ligase-1
LIAPLARRKALAWLAALPISQTSLARATGVQLPLDWPTGRSPQGFLVSEKFDGVRAVWDGRTLRFRSGRAIAAPNWFAGALPDHPLDGELWTGHGQFDRLSAVVRQQRPDSEAWQAVRYLVFDAPGQPGTFESRWQSLGSVIGAANLRWLSRIEQFQVSDARGLQQQLEAVMRAGGEGLMLHRADAQWQPGRSQALYKFKPEPDDEAQVVGYLPGKGRYAGLTGALQVRAADGRQFALGSGLDDALRRDPPPMGSWVTYRYRDRTPSGLPRFATFVRVRPAE